MRSMKLPAAVKMATLASVLFAVSVPVAADTMYKTDQGHTEVRVSWSHAGVSIQTGEFQEASGTVNLAKDIEKSTVDVTVNPGSVSTGVAALDDELKSDLFFDIETYPEITFKSKKVVKTGETTLDVVGDLTMHGTTKEVTLKTVLTHQGPHPLGSSFDYYKGEWIAITATTEIDHQAFGVGSYSTGAITITITSEMKAEG